MRIKIELFGASREFSKNNLIEFNVSNNSKIKDIREEMMKYFPCCKRHRRKEARPKNTTEADMFDTKYNKNTRIP